MPICEIERDFDYQDGPVLREFKRTAERMMNVGRERCEFSGEV
jgi:hypothetical protein